MAKVVAEFDTVDKSLSVKLDGKSVGNVCSFGVYPSYDNKKGYTVSICTEDVDEDNMMSTTHYTRAEKVPEKDLAKVTADIGKYFSN